MCHFLRSFLTKWNLLLQATWKTAKFKTMYLLENLNGEIQETNSSESTRSWLLCLDWLVWWKICRRSFKVGIISFVRNLWDMGQITENSLKVSNCTINENIPCFGGENIKNLKIFCPINTFFVHGNNNNNILVIYCWCNLHTLLLIIVITNQVDQNI